MKIAEAVDFSELYNNDIYIPKKEGIEEGEFNRIKLIAWNSLNELTFQNIENLDVKAFTVFEKNMIKGFMFCFIEGFYIHENSIMTQIGSEGNISLGDYTKGSIKLDKNMKKNDYTTYPFYKMAYSFIARTKFLRSDATYCTIPSNNKIGNW